MSDIRDPGDAWVTAADGKRYWGRFGAAGLLAHDPARDAILLQHRVSWSDHGGTWGIPGGARAQGESAVAAAIRESHEEAAVPPDAIHPRYTHVSDRGGWAYTTIVATVIHAFEAQITDRESEALAWVPLAEIDAYPLHPGFAASWPHLRELVARPPAVVVDAMNVVGSVPDGWWRDRRGANERLRDRLSTIAAPAFAASAPAIAAPAIAAPASDSAPPRPPAAPPRPPESSGVPAGLLGLTEAEHPGIHLAFPEWVLVTEGAARGIADAPGVRVLTADGSGDDAIVTETRRRAGLNHRVAVITSDVELRARVTSAGAAAVRGPRELLRRLPAGPPH